MSLSSSTIKSINNDSFLDLHPLKLPKLQHKPKSRSTARMPSINSPSPYFGQTSTNRHALFKLGQPRVEPGNPGIISMKKPLSFSRQNENEPSIVANVKEGISFNLSVDKGQDQDTTKNSTGSKVLEDLEEAAEIPSMSPSKKTLQKLTLAPSSGNSSEYYNGFSPAVTELTKLEVSQKDVIFVKKERSSILRSNRTRGYLPYAPKGSLSISNIRKIKTDIDVTQQSIEDEEDISIPKLAPTKNSAKEYGSVKAFSANTNHGPVRSYNEDRVSILSKIPKPADSTYEGEWPTCSFFGVFDGHGGDSCANFLKDNLHQMVIKDRNFPANPVSALRKGFAEAEAKFLEEADKVEGETDLSGSCAIVLLIVGDMCYVANVGDSRAVLSCEKGAKVLELSKDHKPNDPVEQARIVKNGGRIYQTQIPQNNKVWLLPNTSSAVLGPHRVFPGRLAISRTIGDIEAKYPKFGGMAGVVISDPEIKGFKITSDCDFIVLASDGIYDKLSSQDVADCVWKSISVKQQNVHQYSGAGVEAIMRQALIKKTTDNITTLLIALQNFEKAVSSEDKDEAENKTVQQLKPLKPLKLDHSLLLKKCLTDRSRNESVLLNKINKEFLENADMTGRLKNLSVLSNKNRKELLLGETTEMTDRLKNMSALSNKNKKDLLTEKVVYKIHKHKNSLEDLKVKLNKFQSSSNKNTGSTGEFFPSPRKLRLNQIIAKNKK